LAAFGNGAGHRATGPAGIRIGTCGSNMSRYWPRSFVEDDPGPDPISLINQPPVAARLSATSILAFHNLGRLYRSSLNNSRSSELAFSMRL
jgi:hypothetical protein